MNPYIVAFLLVSVLVSFLINKYFVDLFENKKMKLNIEAKEGEIRWAPRKPPYGGVSFYVSFMIAQIAFLFIAPSIGIDLFNLKVLAIVLACSIGFFLGLIDDIYNTIPLLKSGGQFVCGLIFIFSDITIHCSNMIIIDYIVTMMWVVGIMNSINMLDNIDSIVTMISIS